MKPYIRVIRTRSLEGCDPRQRAVLAGLGLHKKRREKVFPNSPSIRGAIKKVIHLLSWEELDEMPSRKDVESFVDVIPPEEKKAKGKGKKK